MASVELKYVNTFRDRHGKQRAYYRRNGRRETLPGKIGSAEFLAAYQEKRDRDDGAPAKPASGPQSFDELARIYFASPDFKRLRTGTQRAYRSSLRAFLGTYGTRPVPPIRYEHLSAIIGGMENTPGAANNLLKRLRQLFGIARRLGWIEADPSEGIRYFRTGEIHTWNAEEHAQFLKHWPPGSMPRLAYMAHLHTGQRKSDVVMLPMPKTQEDGFRVTQVKTGAKLDLPCPAILWEEIGRHPRRVMLIETSHGKPFTANGYGNWFRARCGDAGMPAHCSSHGLRKAAATELAEAGCTTKEIQAVTGHTSLQEVERYTRAASQRRLAQEADRKRSQNKV